METDIKVSIPGPLYLDSTCSPVCIVSLALQVTESDHTRDIPYEYFFGLVRVSHILTLSLSVGLFV